MICNKIEKTGKLDTNSWASNIWQTENPERQNRENREEEIIKIKIQENFPDLRNLYFHTAVAYLVSQTMNAKGPHHDALQWNFRKTVIKRWDYKILQMKTKE